jgi:glutathione S-transferase
MITLYQFKPAFGLPNPSPFCMKVETYLRMVGLPYQCQSQEDLTNAPKKKLPFIDDDGTIIADSSLILQYLTQKYGNDLDAHLTPVQRAQLLSIQTLFEEHFYWSAVYSRWMDPVNWPQVRQAFFGKLPPVIKSIIPIIAHRQIAQYLNGHGMGRHSAAEIYAFGQQDIQAFAALLGDQDYFMGAQPSTLDAIAYSFLANILWVSLPSPLLDCAKQFPNLEVYCQRMRSQYYPT